MTPPAPPPSPSTATTPIWPLVAAATLILMVTMGIRQSLGLFVQPLALDVGLSIAQISFALAVAQLVWGLAQPAFGAAADHYGPGRVLVIGGLLMALGLALAPLFPGPWGLVMTLGLLSAAGAGAGSFSVLIGATAQRIPAERRSMTAGTINAGGSFGQFLFAPLTQAAIGAFGWAVALWTLALATLATLPLARPLRGRAAAAPASTAVPSPAATPAPSRVGTAAKPAVPGLRAQLAMAVRDRSYWLLHLGFFTCGFHIAFMVTHLPTEIALCGLSEGVSATSLALIGLFNVGGSLAAGWLGQRYRMKMLLAAMYASRAALIVIYLMSPPTPTTFYLFAAGLGATWLATVPPTAGLVGKLFGPRYLGTLFGLTLVSHQIGGFLGAWTGGLALEALGDYTVIWYADIALALIAAVAHLPIREARVRRTALAAA